jgi:hypothetical protein
MNSCDVEGFWGNRLEGAHNPKVRGSNPLPATKDLKGDLTNSLSPFCLCCQPSRHRIVWISSTFSMQ